jgi:hypothetical protein
MHTESPREKERPGGQAGLFNMAEFDTAGLRPIADVARNLGIAPEHLKLRSAKK